MTVIEFFVKSPLENMISCFSLNPEKVVLVGKGVNLYNASRIFKGVAKSLKLKTNITEKTYPSDSIDEICDTLVKIVEENDDCCFDLTGGDDLALVAMGIVYQKYKEQKDLIMQRFDIKTGRLVDCVTNEDKPSNYDLISLSARDYISLYGGDIKKFSRWEKDVISSVEKLWKICSLNPTHWNKFINILGRSSTTCDEYAYDNDAVFNASLYESTYGNESDAINVLSLLSAGGLIYNLRRVDTCYHFSYGNKVVKRCLFKAGDLLEMFVLASASIIKKNDGNALFNDCITNVEIDWDGRYGDGYNKDGSINEIDVFLMKGLLPVFISCKNGKVDENELYKLFTVANRFGGHYVKKILVMSDLNTGDNFSQRARDMGITVIDNVMSNTMQSFSNRLKNILY